MHAFSVLPMRHWSLRCIWTSAGKSTEKGPKKGIPFSITVLSRMKQFVPRNNSSSAGMSIPNATTESSTLQHEFKTVDETAKSVRVFADRERPEHGQPAQLADREFTEAVLADHERLQRLQVDEEGVHGVATVVEIGMPTLETVLANLDGTQQGEARECELRHVGATVVPDGQFLQEGVHALQLRRLLGEGGGARVLRRAPEKASLVHNLAGGGDELSYSMGCRRTDRSLVVQLLVVAVDSSIAHR